VSVPRNVIPAPSPESRKPCFTGTLDTGFLAGMTN